MVFSTKQYFIYILLVSILIFISYFYFDRTIAQYFIFNIESYEKTGDFISIFGASDWYIGAGVLGFLFFKFIKVNKLYEQRALFLLYINLFSGLISLIFKQLFGRLRPWGLRANGDEFGFLLFDNLDISVFEKIKLHIFTMLESSTKYSSFPSGHTTTVFAMFTYLSIFFPKYIYLWFIVSIILVSGRILANDHFLSDIPAGILVGTISTMFVYSKMKVKVEKVY